MRFRARTNDKRQLDVNWDLVNTYLSKWKPRTLLDIDITRHQEKRSDPLRKYYFAAVVKPFMNHEGYEVDEVDLFHFQLKVAYFQHNPGGIEYNLYQDKHGIWRNVPSVFGNKSTMDVSIKKEFVDWVIRKAAKAGVYIEDPS